MGRSLLLALLLVWPGWLSAQPDAPLLFTPVAVSAAVASAQGQSPDGVRRRTYSRPRPTALRDARRAAAERVTLNLFDDLRVVARRDQVSALDEDGLYWAGEIEGEADGHATFVLRGSWLAGHVQARGRTVLIRSQADGLHLVEEVDPVSQPSCGGHLAPPSGPSSPSVGATPAVGAGRVRPDAGRPAAAESHGPAIDLLVVYSAQARAAAGGTEALRASIDLAVVQMNQALTNSAVAGHVRLVAAREVAQPESGSMTTDLDNVTGVNNGVFDEVHAWRNELGADVVSLITNQASEGWAGLAWIMTDINSPFASYAFSVVRRPWLTDYTLAHEIGHNLGLAHDYDNSQGQPGVFPYAYGYRDPPFFRDLMSYACPGLPCPQIGHFSNPDVFYQGRPTGTAAREDAARALRQTLPVAAAFRSGVPLLTSVWPATGSTLGGERVRLQGERLDAVARVLFGTFEASDIIVLSPIELSVGLPSQPQRVVDVRVEDLEGRSSTLAASFSYIPGPGDTDGDALPDEWELAMGLDPADPTGVNGADGDANGNGISNFDSYRTHRHPLGFHERYFAEGASSTFFDTRVALMNPGDTAAGAVLRYQRGDGTIQGTWLAMPPRTRQTVDIGAASGMANAEFSTVIESDVPLVADRTMSWNTVDRYGAHAETSVPAPATRWYLAEGATHSGFQLFYLLQNPSNSQAEASVRYLRPDGAPIAKTYAIPPTSRTNIWVNVETFPGLGQALAATEVSADIQALNDVPIIVERAMYLDGQGVMFNAGHASAGVTAPALQWFLAEGATGPYFDLFVLIANPGQADANVELTYLLDVGTTYSRTLVAPAGSRTSVWVDHEQFPGVPGYPLADVAVSTTVRSTNGVPIIVERAMWWPGDFSTWHEAHNSAGSTATGTRWALAEGEAGGPRDVETYILIANTSAFDGSATVTLLFEDGSSVAHVYALRANSRTNVPVGDVEHFGVDVQGRRFSAIVESTGTPPAQIVVERAMYWDALGRRWAAGTNALGTRLQ